MLWSDDLRGSWTYIGYGLNVHIVQGSMETWSAPRSRVRDNNYEKRCKLEGGAKLDVI